jgi:predicted amidophosphoribosyltransferase
VKHDLAEIEAGALWRSEGDDYYVLSYPPKRKRTIATDFILDFKSNDKDAVSIGAKLVIAAIRKLEPILKGNLCKYIVSIPSSAAGRENRPCEQVCVAVEREFNWLKHLPKALCRTKSVPKSAFARPGNRPSYDDHRASIDYVGMVRDRNASFVVLDDVITIGTVSRCCRDILLEKSECKKVIGVFLGRTE